MKTRTVRHTVSHWSDSLVLSTLSWLATAANCFLVPDRVTLWNSDGWGLAAETIEGTDLTGSNIFQCNVRGRPFPSSWGTVNTGMDGLGCVVTMYTSSSHLSAILCFPWNPTYLTKTWSQGCKVAPRTFLLYQALLASPALRILSPTTLCACYIRFRRSAIYAE